MPQNATIEQLCCALFYMLSRQAKHPEQQLNAAISDHFQWLASHNEGDQYPQLIKISRRLARHWEPKQHTMHLMALPALKRH